MSFCARGLGYNSRWGCNARRVRKVGAMSAHVVLGRGLAISLAFAAVFFGKIIVSRADAVLELASFSVFNNVNLPELAKAEAKPARGLAMSNTRFLSVQTCWVAPGSPAQQLDALRRWNPAKAELKIFVHANGSDFSRLKDAPNNRAVQALVSATEKMLPELQISKEEAAKFSAGAGGGSGAMPAAITNFWSTVLGARAQAFASGGSSAQPSYDHSEQAIRPGEELSGLLRQQDKIRKQFSPFLENSGIGRGAGGKPEQYWELTEVDNKGVLTLGASYNRAGAGGSQQAADVLYYASGGFYAALTLYQMWPVEVEGKLSTLVWRGDMISSPELADLRGVERLGAESSMMKDVSKAVRLFRRDTGGAR